jgi:hypothetical protein
MDDDPELLVRFPQAMQKEIPVRVRQKYRLFLITSGENVIKRPLIFDPQLSRHSNRP